MVSDRPVTDIAGRQRLRYAGARMRAWLRDARHPSQLGIYPALVVAVLAYTAMTILLLLTALLLPELRGTAIASTITLSAGLVIVILVAGVLIGMAPFGDRARWRIVEASSSQGYAGVRYRRDRTRRGCYLEDLCATARGTKLGLVMPALAAGNGDEPLQLKAATPRLVPEYAKFGFRPTSRGLTLLSGYLVPMTRPETATREIL